MAFNIDDYLATESVPYSQQNLTTYEQQALQQAQPSSYEPQATQQSNNSGWSPSAPSSEPFYGGYIPNFINDKAASPVANTAFQTLGDSFSSYLKKNGGEIFANTMVGSANSVLKYLADRRTQKMYEAQIDKKYQYETASKNAEVARASAMPNLTSVVKPTVTGKQLVGSQKKSGGLIGSVQQRG